MSNWWASNTGGTDSGKGGGGWSSSDWSAAGDESAGQATETAASTASTGWSASPAPQAWNSDGASASADTQAWNSNSDGASASADAKAWNSNSDEASASADAKAWDSNSDEATASADGKGSTTASSANTWSADGDDSSQGWSSDTKNNSWSSDTKSNSWSGSSGSWVSGGGDAKGAATAGDARGGSWVGGGTDAKAASSSSASGWDSKGSGGWGESAGGSASASAGVAKGKPQQAAVASPSAGKAAVASPSAGKAAVASPSAGKAAAVTPSSGGGIVLGKGAAKATTAAPSQVITPSPTPVIISSKGKCAGKAAAAAVVEAGPAFKVTTKTKQNDPMAMAVVGDYADFGTNHGCKSYKRTTKANGSDVYLYYWDLRDGPDYSGWWFGDAIGGDKPFAHALAQGATPPQAGWKLPWNISEPQPGALLVDPGTAAAPVPAVVATPAPVASKGGWGGKANSGGWSIPAAAAAPAATPAPAAPMASAASITRVKVTLAQAGVGEKASTALVDVAKKLLENESTTAQQVKAAMENMEKQQVKLKDFQTTLTSELPEVRKGGQANVALMKEMLEMQTKLKNTLQALTLEMAKLRTKLAKAEIAEKKLREEAALKAQEAKDSAALKTVLAKSNREYVAAEAAVEAVGRSVGRLLESPPQEAEKLEAKQTEIETAAEAARLKVESATSELATKLTAAGEYAPEARKAAFLELKALQKKHMDLQRRVLTYKNIKRDFQKLLAANKRVQEITEKVAAAESEVTEVDKMSKATVPEKMTEEDVNRFDELVTPARRSLLTCNSLINSSFRGSDSATQAALEKLRARAAEQGTKLDAAVSKLQSQRDVILAQAAISSAKTKADECQALLRKCQDAELPFLKGLEVLPKDESDEALEASEGASKEAFAAIAQAKLFLKARIADVKRLPKELADSIEEQLPPQLARVEAVEKKVVAFSKETADRRLAALLADVVEAVVAAEGKAQSASDATKFLASSAMEDASPQKITDAVDKAKVIEQEAGVSCRDAKALAGAKQREAKAAAASAPLQKIQTRINEAQEKLSKARAAIATAEKVVKAKALIEEQEEKLSKVESDVAKAEKSVPAAEDAKLSEATVKILDTTFDAAMEALKPLGPLLQPFLSSTPAKTKASLQELLDRKKAVENTINTIKVATKARRESLLSDKYLTEAQELFGNAESCVEELAVAEGPFLKGIEQTSMPLQEVQKILEACDKAAKSAAEALGAVRTHCSQKLLETKLFAAEPAKLVRDGFATINTQVGSLAQKLSTFQKDMQDRVKVAKVREAGEMVDEAEEGVLKEAIAAVEPFSKDGAENMTEEEAAAPLKLFMDAEKQARLTFAQVKTFLAARLVEAKGSDRMEVVKKLQERVSGMEASLVEASKPTMVHEQRSQGSRLIKEVCEKVGALEAEVEQATEVCAPLLEKGGVEFLIDTSLRTLATALQAHMKSKELNEEALFKEAFGRVRSMKKDAFLAYLEKLPDAIGHEEIGFTAERREEIFDRLAAKGIVGRSEFQSIFNQRCVCKQGVTVTPNFDVSDGEAVCQLKPNDELDCFGELKEDEVGLVRSKCRVLEGDQEGWVTLQQGKGPRLVNPVVRFVQFCNSMDAAMAAAQAHVGRTMTFISAKLREAGAASTGPLADAKTELAKLKDQVTTISSKIDALKKKAGVGRQDFAKKEKSELNAHIELKNRKEAAAIIDVVEPLVEAAEKAATDARNAAVPMLDLQDKGAIAAFPTPATILAATEKLVNIANEKISKAHTVRKEQFQVASQVAPPTGASTEAKRQLQLMQQRLDAAAKAMREALKTINGHCGGIVASHQEKVIEAVRRDAVKAGGIEKLFDSLAKGKDSIPQAVFAKMVQGWGISAEHAKLVADRVQKGGISKRAFLSFAQLYYTVVKDIAFTDVVEVSACKTLRKAEADEIVEILEGPTEDAKSNLQRVRARSLLDDVEGWMTLCGNQGTPFLKPVPKPYYVCRKDLTMTTGPQHDSGLVKSLKAEEVLEMVGGPRNLPSPDLLRARVKANKDGKVGWITMKEDDSALNTAIVLVIKSSVAMTAEKVLKGGKPIRTLAADEEFVADGEPMEVEGVTRAQGKSSKDGVEGWITMTGSAGTVYAEIKSKCYSTKEIIIMEKQQKCNSGVVRKLEVGETLQLIDGPRAEKCPDQPRVKVRSLRDGATGWTSAAAEDLKKFTGSYKCIQPTPLTAEISIASAELRELTRGEQLDFLEGPTEDGGNTRLKLRAAKDGVEGWATVRDGEGKKFLD